VASRRGKKRAAPSVTRGRKRGAARKGAAKKRPERKRPAKKGSPPKDRKSARAPDAANRREAAPGVLARMLKRGRASAPDPPEPVKGNRRLVPREPEVVEPKPRLPFRERLRAMRAGVAEAWARTRRTVILIARVALVVAIVAGAIAVGRLVERHVRTSPAFAVTELRVEGQERLLSDDALEAAGLEEGANVFDVAPEDARARLLAHPWVADAEVRRRLPGTFEVRIREHRAVAVLVLTREPDATGDLYLVGEDGTVFKSVGEHDPVDLPVITGVDRERFTRDQPWRTQLLLEVVALLHDYRGAGLWRREPIGEVHVEPDDGLSLYVGDDATHVRLGRAPFRRKLRRLRRVPDRPQREETRPFYVYLDNVRRPDRVTVRLRH